MEKIIAVTFDVADQKCKMYNAHEWHNFIADTREQFPDCAELEIDNLLEVVYGDEFWWELTPSTKAVYAVAFDLTVEEFVICSNDAECEMFWEMAQAAGDQDQIFWAD